MKKITLILALFLVAGCENVDKDLWNQVSFKTQEAPRKLNPSRSIPAFGTRVSYADVDGVTLESKFPLDAKAAQRGKKPYDIFCSVCHGLTGKSDTPVAKKMEVMPFDLTEEGTQELTDGEIFVKILASESIMPHYRNELSDEEAWEIVAHIRQLQN